MNEKIIITKRDTEVQKHLDKGYTVKSVTAQHVDGDPGYPNVGRFCFILSPPKNPVKS